MVRHGCRNHRDAVTEIRLSKRPRLTGEEHLRCQVRETQTAHHRPHHAEGTRRRSSRHLVELLDVAQERE